MAPVLAALSTGMRVGASTITARAASTLQSSAATSVPVAAPKKTLLRPGLVQSGAAPSRGRRGGRRVSQAVSPLLSWPDADAEAGVDALTSSSLAAADVPDLPGLWPPIDATSTESEKQPTSSDAASAEQPTAAQDGHGSPAAEHATAAAAAEEEAAEEQQQEEELAQAELPEPEPLLQHAGDAHLAASDAAPALHAAEALPAAQQAQLASATAAAPLLHKEPPTPTPAADAQHPPPFQLQPNAAPYSPTSLAQHHHLQHTPDFHVAAGAAEEPHHPYHHHHAASAQPYTPRQPSYSYAGSTACGSSMASAAFHKDQNSVTIKADTKVKDAAGAIAKVLDRLCSTLVTALQQPATTPHHPPAASFDGAPPTPAHHSAAGHSAPFAGGGGWGQHEALNRAVKALAVCRKYVTDASPPDSGVELGFLPVNRSDAWGRADASLFSFLAFKSVVQPGYQGTPHHSSPSYSPAGTSTGSPLAASSAASSSEPAAGGADASSAAAMAMVAADPHQQQHQHQELHVSSNSDPVTVASHLVRAVLDHGQAVMKAGGGNALFVAMTAVVQARTWLKGWHAMDILLVPQWITEDTRATLGRESKFVQFNVLPSGLHGVLTDGSWQPAIVPMQPPPAASGPQLSFA